MGWRILLLSEPSKISLANNSLVVKKESKELLSIPLVDIDMVVIENQQISITSALLGRVASENISVIVCDDYHQPSGIINPVGTNVRHSQFAKAQLQFSQKKKDELWRAILHQKILNQSFVLAIYNHKEESQELIEIANRIHHGDAVALEGYAASLYFKTLFPNLIRKSNTEIDARNDALNYGYSVLRATILRSIAASGLLSVVGIWHSSNFNPGNLADDIIEPFRPFVDIVVRNIFYKNPNQPTIYKKEKLELLAILQSKISIDSKTLTTSAAIGICVDSLRKSFLNGDNVLKLPILGDL